MLHPRERELDNSALIQTVPFTVTFTFMVFCWAEQHLAHLAPIPVRSVPPHSEEAGSRHYNSVTRRQLGFAGQIRFYQPDVLRPGAK